MLTYGVVRPESARWTLLTCCGTKPVGREMWLFFEVQTASVIVANSLRIAICNSQIEKSALFINYFMLFFSTVLSLLTNQTVQTFFWCLCSLSMQLYKQSIHTQGEVSSTCSLKLAWHLGFTLFCRSWFSQFELCKNWTRQDQFMSRGERI